MTFTNTQTKLGQAITTNASGDYAVRTIIEGDQTLENLTLTGDLNGGGGHILNDQTTTNMMSKGTVYRFDGVDDLITVTANADIANLTAGGMCIEGWIYPKSDGGANAGRILDKNGGTAGFLFYVSSEAGGYVALYFAVDAATDGSWSCPVIIPINTWSHVALVYDGSSASNVPTFYLNGTALTTTVGTQRVGALVDDTASNLTIGNKASADRAFDGSMAEIKISNHAKSASEIKDFSGNLPFKWQYGSQTSLVTGDDSDFDTAGGWVAHSEGL